MRVYVSVDMEGLAGVSHPAQTVVGPNGIDRADYDRSAATPPGVERIGPRSVAFTADDADTLYRWFVSCLRLSNVPVS